MDAPPEATPPPRDGSSSRQRRGKVGAGARRRGWDASATLTTGCGADTGLPWLAQASFGTQARALFRKNGIQQKRAWKSSCFLVATPIFFCVLLFVLQKVINSALDTPDNKCGCLCTECCSSASGVEVCRPAGADSRCTPAETCKTYDTTRCGLQYSDSQQANWCAIPSPSSWPALMQAAAPGYLARPWAPAAAVLYTGDSEAGAAEMASRLVTAATPTAAQQRELEDLIAEGAASVSSRPGSLAALRSQRGMTICLDFRGPGRAGQAS